MIPLRDITDAKVGSWHSSRWAAGAPAVKILWRRGEKGLSSGFVFSVDLAET